MTSTLRKRFLAIEEQFLSAFAIGQGALATFVDTWSTLNNDLARANKTQRLDQETLTIAQATASRIAVLSESLLSLDVEAEKAWNLVMPDLLDILSQVGKTSPSSSCDMRPPLLSEMHPSSYPTAHPSPSSAIHPSSSSISPRHPAPTEYLSSHRLHRLSAEWLIQNLQDPYPSSDIKEQISGSCDCSVRDVQEWFRDARRWIGWTTLSGERFGGSRRATSEAASRAYSDSEDVFDNGLPLDVRRAFATMKANAYSLFSGHTLTSASESRSSPVPASSGKTLPPFSQEPSDRDIRTFPCPSLNAAPSSSAANSSTTYSVCFSADEEEDITPPPPVAGCKRRLDMSTEIEGHESASSVLSRPIKRQRYASLSTITPSYQAPMSGEALHLGQPDTTHVSTLAESTTRSSVASTPLPSAIVTSSSPEATERMSRVADPAPIFVSTSPRKRRLSDSFAGNSPKRPRGLTSTSRRQAVSDPLPIDLGSASSEMHVLGGWLQSSCDVPYATEFSNVNRSYSCAADLTTQSNTTSSISSLGPVSLPSECYISDADLVSATPKGFDFSAYNSTGSGFGFEPGFDVATSDSSSASTPSSAASYSELSDFGLADNPSDWTRDWSQFLNILDSFGSSPTSSQSSLSDLSPPCPPTLDSTPDSTSLSSPDDFTHTLFGVDPSFNTSDLLSGIGELSSVHFPLEATF